jgi:hypothetical protein
MLSPLDQLRSSDGSPDSELAKTISLLFESSGDVTAALAPQAHVALAKSPPGSYGDIIDRALEVMNSWKSDEKVTPTS